MRKIVPKKLTKLGMEAPMPTERYPSFGIDLIHLPEAKKWKPGQNYRFVLEVTMTELVIEERKGKEDYDRAGFDIKAIEGSPMSPKKVKRYT